MRILVIDDQLVIESGVARAVEGHGGHTVVGARSPAELRVRLEEDTDFQLAFVDMHYGPRASESGLAALEALDQHDIPSIIYSADGERNRPLLILAAFEFFPRTCTIVPKDVGHKAIHSVVDAVARGYSPNGAAALRYRPARGERNSLLQQLIGRRDDLLLWRALATHTALPVIAKAAHCSERKVSEFMALRRPIISQFQYQLLDQEIAPEPPQGKYHSNLLEVSLFAQPNADFFTYPEVERLIAECWGDTGRRSDAARAGDASRRFGHR